MDLFGLKGRVAVVTGASSGLGADAARAYAAYGADVALVARRKERLESLAEELRREGVKALPVACDVSREDDVRAAVERIMDYFERVDILLNDAGVAVPGGVEMRERRYGKIVNISSVNATLADKVPELWRHAYNASKAAVKGLTVGMAASYAADNITVNSIGPGLFESEMTENTLFRHEAFMQMYDTLTPASRPGAKGELNGTILYFSSQASSYVTGQHIIVDGGFSIV